MRNPSPPSPQSHRTSYRFVVAVLLCLVLLPVLLLTLYELAGLNATESVIVSTYDQQLDGMLSSVNQYAWDVASGWASSIARSVMNGGNADSVISAFLGSHESLESGFLADTSGRLLVLVGNRPDSLLRVRIAELLGENSSDVRRLVRLREGQYTKLGSYVVDSATGNSRVALMYVLYTPSGEVRIGGFVINPEMFVKDILGPKLRETAGSEFVVAVIRRGYHEPVLTTDSVMVDQITRRRALWIFPEFQAGIRFKGTSVEELAANRSRRTIVMVGLIDLALLAGVVLMYRNLRRQAEFTRQKSDFVSNVSHELRTPLALIRMYAETLEMGRVKGKEKEYYTTIVAESARLTRLVNNILNFSRMEAGRMPYRLENISLNRIVEDVLRLWEGQFQAEDVRTVVELTESLPTIVADSEAIMEALINLVDNALKYGGTQKYLRLVTGTEQNRVFVSVEDHGIGIGQQHVTRIFDMFYRVSGGLVQTTRGSGVGLAIVRHIIDAHGGEVRVSSTPGAGSTFTLFFPIDRSHSSMIANDKD